MFVFLLVNSPGDQTTESKILLEYIKQRQFHSVHRRPDSPSLPKTLGKTDEKHPSLQKQLGLSDCLIERRFPIRGTQGVVLQFPWATWKTQKINLTTSCNLI